jgi:two-component system sensor histidine kinase KdpD
LGVPPADRNNVEIVDSARKDIGALQRAAGLRRAGVGLKAIERRRSELWSMSLLGMGALTAVIAVLTVGQELITESFRLQSLSQWSILVLLGGLLLSMIVYVAEKEIALRRISKSLLEERVVAEALRLRLSELSHFTEVAKAMNATLDLEDVFEKILDAALELLGGDEASVMLLDDVQQGLRVVASRGTALESAKGTVLPLDEGLPSMAATKRSAVLLGPDDPSSEGVHSAMSIPLVRRDELLGVLNVIEASGGKTYDMSDLGVLDLFAEYAAIALTNARIVAKERDTISKLEELDSLKNDFVATVSHELRSPLTSIIGSAQTLTRTGDRLRPEDRQEFLVAIDRQGKRLQRLIEDILTSSKMEAGTFQLHREEVDLKRLGQDLIQDLVSSPFVGDRKIELIAPDGQALMWGDPHALQQILGNLIENACKYSSKSSPVYVRVQTSPTQANIEVRDEGYGIPPADIPYIFDRFHRVEGSTTHSVQGAGIGLSIVKNLVEVSGGKITVESEVDKGTTFSVRLPQRSARRPETAAEPQADLISSNPV